MPDHLTERFLRRLTAADACRDVSLRSYAGVQFLYILADPDVNEKEVRRQVERTAAHLTRGIDRFHECVYVRQSRGRWVYRFRFRVPEEKSFCCGNHCVDCVLLRPRPGR